MIGKFIQTALTPSLRAAGFADDVRFDVSIEKTYRIYAISTWKNDEYYCVISDFDQPTWIPGSLFEIVEPDVPSDWITSSFCGELSAISGPNFIAQNENDYSALVALEPEAVCRFWEYVKHG